MKTLFRLRFTQRKAAIRNLFAKPLPAIISIVVIAVYGSILIPLFLHADAPPISGFPAYVTILGILGFGLMMQFITLVQNKRSLFFEGDAFYLYTGPFPRRTILGLYAFDNFTSALLLGLVSLLPIVYATSENSSVPLLFIVAAFLAGALVQYCLLTLTGILYLRALSGQGKTGRAGTITMAFLGLCLVGVGAAAFLTGGAGSFDLQSIVASPQLNWLPFFGWARLVLLAVLEGNVLNAAIGAALLVGAAALLTLIQLGHKGDFYERSMQDAETFTAYYQKARQGKSGEDGKVHKANVRFAQGAGAILSKNWLIALKGRELLRLQDFIVIAIYLAIAYFANSGFILFAAMLMFWMMMMVSNSSMVDDLQHHYVYLIPGGALQKLLCTLAIPLGKNAIVLAISLLGGGLLMGETLPNILIGLAVCLTVLLVMTSGNVLALRLMKSRSNKMVEQTLRMLTVLLALLPGGALALLLLLVNGGAFAGFAVWAFIAVNLVFAGIVLCICAPMMRGNELNAD